MDNNKSYPHFIHKQKYLICGKINNKWNYKSNYKGNHNYNNKIYRHLNISLLRSDFLALNPLQKDIAQTFKNVVLPHCNVPLLKSKFLA